MARARKTTAKPLPMRDGICAHSVWLPAGDWNSMLDFLAERFPDLDAEIWVARMRKGDVVTEQGVPVAPDTGYTPNTRLFYYRELESETDIPFEHEILYRDEHILIVDKPHFLPVVPAGRFLQHTLMTRLKHQLNMDHLVPMNRIDRETAGLVMFSLNIATRDVYHALFREQRIHKTYHAIASVLPERAFPLQHRSRIVQAEDFFRRREAVGEPNSETRIDVIEQQGELALYRLEPVTGKTHQLRVHMASLGAPILNDPYYPQLSQWKGDDFSRPLQLLARTLEFVDPVTARAMCFDSRRCLTGF